MRRLALPLEKVSAGHRPRGGGVGSSGNSWRRQIVLGPDTDPTYRGEFNRAVGHLGPEGAKFFQELENKLTEKKAYVFVVPGNGKFEPSSSGRLGWDPRLASRNTNGTTQSPALVLIHELGHAFHWVDNPVAYSERADMKREDVYGHLNGRGRSIQSPGRE